MTVVRWLAGIALGCTVAGCQSGPPLDPLPDSTSMTVTGDDPVKYVASADGHISVYDENQQRSVFDGRIKSGQTLTLDPVERRVMIDDKATHEQVLTRGDKVRVTFAAN